MPIQENLLKIHKRIDDYIQIYHRAPNSVRLLAVSKKQSAIKIAEAYALGQRAFGENYVQEALEKMALLHDKAIEWHFIGPIQRNKTRKIAEHFSWVHSISDLLVAKRLNEQRPAHLGALNICIEVNLDNEATKSGIQPETVLQFANELEQFSNLKLRGLMAIPLYQSTFEIQRQTFHRLAALFQDLQKTISRIDTLSMGMTHDFEAAIAEGATIVRIGTAIFGQR